MPIVTFSRRTRTDIAEIWEYIAEDSVTQADALVDRLGRQFEILALQPNLGRARDELAKGMRSFPFQPYLIVYSVIQDGIHVVRVLHSARDIEAQFASRA